MTYFDRKKRPINKFGKMDIVDDNNTEITSKVIDKNIYNTTSQLRSGI